MRPHLLAALLFLTGVAPLAIARDAHADFDPSGRGKKKPRRLPGKPRPTPSQLPRDDDSDPKRPSADVLIARYTGVALSQPSEPSPLQRLAELYRTRDGNLKKLVEDFEKRVAAGGAEQWAARVVLAGVYKQDGRYDDAVKTYRSAIAERPQEPSARMALGHILADHGDKAEAQAEIESALPLLKGATDIEQARRSLLTLSLDLHDEKGAKRHHEALVKAAGGSLFVRAELARELAARGQYEGAEVELREVVKAASGDNRALAPALRDLGKALAKQKKMEEALATLRRALSVAGSAAGVRAEILMIMTDAFRAEGKLPELIALLEAEKGTADFQKLAMMGALYEETGSVDKAIATYKKALAADAKQIDVRLKLVHLYQTAGELDTAIQEYEALIRAAPQNPDFVFELCETLIQRGDRSRALKLLGELEARAHEDDTLAAVADFYERVEEKDRALKVLQKLAGTGADPTHIIDLGDRYFQAGDKKRAMETWARIKVVVPHRARAAATLGEVYLDHDMGAEAITALREAVELDPGIVRYKKALAIAYERTATSTSFSAIRYEDARALWESILASAGPDRMLAREARTHIVSLWALTRQHAAQIAPLTHRFHATPPDLEAGRLLAEVQRKLGRLPAAEATLRRVVELAPGDADSLLSLERVLVQAQHLEDAIAVLAKLVEVEPKRAREFYQRMAQYARDQYHDDDAITYAARAVELSPNDAVGHQKLGEMYKHRQDVPHAIAEYRLAIAQNDRLFPVYFELAELLLSTGQAGDADRLFRRVVRASTDEELVARAARMSMQVNLSKGTLAELERELLPVAVGNPQKPIYRRLLVELYGAMTFPLVWKLRGADPQGPAATDARAELGRIGARAVKPLLDALADDKESQQKIAIMVLGYVANKSAGPALYNYAVGTADKALRVRAMLACGALRDPALLPRYEQMLVPNEGAPAVLPNDAIAVAAVWGVARMGDRRAEPLLSKLLTSAAPEVRALAAIGLGLTHDRKHAPALTALARSPEAGTLTRAAALHALAELGTALDPTIFLIHVDSSDPLLRRASLLALARRSSREDAGKTGSAAEAIAASLFSTEEALRSAAWQAGVALATHTYRRRHDPLPIPEGLLTVRDVLMGLAPDPSGPAERAAALLALASAVRKAAVAAVATSPERARVVADALLVGEGKLGLLPFTAGIEAADATLRTQVDAVVESIAAAVVPGFAALERHPAIEVRTRAVEFLALRPEVEAQAAVVDALDDPEPAVRRAALGGLGLVPSERLLAAVGKQVKDPSRWPLRVRAVEALGRLGSGAEASRAQIIACLSAAARDDPYALVREAAVQALASVDPKAARPLLEELATKDPEPRVREAAATLLK